MNRITTRHSTSLFWRLTLASLVLFLLQVSCVSKPISQTTNAPQPNETPNSCQLDVPAFGPQEQVVRRTGYTEAFDSNHHLAKWVGYELTSQHLQEEVVERSDHFAKDPDFASSEPGQYKHSGFDQGHLAPAADMRWSQAAMLESFYHGNIAPQTPALNRGAWKQLEARVRVWAEEYGKVDVITGPVLEANLPKLTGSDVSIPRTFFKVVLAPTQLKAIGFLMSQDPNPDLRVQAVSVDEVERVTSLDFFACLPKDQQERIEARANFDEWSLPKKLRTPTSNHR